VLGLTVPGMLVENVATTATSANTVERTLIDLPPRRLPPR
jgi:hypothetical protein